MCYTIDNILIQNKNYLERRIFMSWDFAQMWSNFLNWLADVTPKLLLAIVIFVVGWWTVKLIIMFVKKGLAKMGVEKRVITFLSSFCKYILRICLLYTSFLAVQSLHPAAAYRRKYIPPLCGIRV